MRMTLTSPADSNKAEDKSEEMKDSAKIKAVREDILSESCSATEDNADALEKIPSQSEVVGSSDAAEESEGKASDCKEGKQYLVLRQV